MRDLSLFESALAWPRQLASYGDPDLADLAAAYGYGLAKNHSLICGNRRTAFVAVELFIDRNGQALTADDADCVLVMLAVAAGMLSEAEFADWIRQHTASR